VTDITSFNLDNVL